MRELFNMLLAEARGMWRFRWYGLGVAWLVALVGAVVVYGMSNQYTAQARVNVDTQSILRPLLKGIAVQPDVETKVRMVTNTLLSRPNLEKIARETDLMLQADNAKEEQQIVEGLRNQIVISAGDEQKQPDLYTISYSSSSPEQAQHVVQTTLDILMEQTLGSTRRDSNTAQAFLKQQVDQFEERLQEAEQRLATFKRENSGLLPSQEGGYYQRLHQAQQTLGDLKEQLSIAQSRRQSLTDEIEAMKSGESLNNPRVQELDRQIQANSQRLNELLLQYTDSHPDVVALEDSIERLRAERERAEEGGSSGPVPNLASNPVFQNLQVSLNNTNTEIATLNAKISRQEQQIDDLKSRVDQIVDVEARLANLTRNYEVTNQRYQELLNRLNSAELSSDADQTGGQVGFRVIDPPVLPLQPSGPDRVLYMLAVFAVSLGAGGALTLFVSQIKPAFLDGKTLAQVTGRPVLGAVTLIRTAAQERAAKGAVGGFVAATVILIAVVGIGVIFADTGSNIFRTWMGGGFL